MKQVARQFLPTVDDRHDRLAFGTAFVAGGAAIVFLRVLFQLGWLYVAAPAAVLVGYWIYAVSTRRGSVSLDRAGDNVYYLGLLFTLISLSISLIEVSTSSEADILTFALVGGFGVALVSTIIGMFLRVLTQQLRYDPIDVEATTRLELAEAGRTLRTELFSINADLGSYRNAISQSLAEISEDLSRRMRESSESAASAIARTASQLESLSAHLGSVASLIERFASAEDSIDASASQLNQIVDNTVAALDALQASAEQHTATIQKLGGSEVVSSLTLVASSLEAAADRTDRIASNLDNMSSKLNSASQSIAENESQLVSLRRSVAEAERMLAEMQSGLTATVRALRSEIRGA